MKGRIWERCYKTRAFGRSHTMQEFG